MPSDYLNFMYKGKAPRIAVSDPKLFDGYNQYRYSDLDYGLRSACRAINKNKGVRTVDSCLGVNTKRHPMRRYHGYTWEGHEHRNVRRVEFLPGVMLVFENKQAERKWLAILRKQEGFIVTEHQGQTETVSRPGIISVTTDILYGSGLSCADCSSQPRPKGGKMAHQTVTGALVAVTKSLII